MFIMNRLSTAKRVQIISALVEGNSLRSTSRMADVSINTVTKLLVDVGTAALKFQDETLRNLPCKRIECDEIWAFVGGKDKNLSEEKRAQGLGSIWVWTALCADTKLIVTWLVGGRDAGAAYEFMQDLAPRLRKRIQLTTDGHKVYVNAVEDAFGADVDYAMLTKVYGAAQENETRYSPAKILSSSTEVIKGSPDPKLISTSYVERHCVARRLSSRAGHSRRVSRPGQLPGNFRHRLASRFRPFLH
jgi:IS1 family transposase